MAQRVEVLLEDDLDGSEAAATVEFALDGASYEIDLSEVHIDELRASFAPWLEKARRTGGRRTQPDAPAPSRKSSGSTRTDPRRPRRSGRGERERA